MSTTTTTPLAVALRDDTARELAKPAALLLPGSVRDLLRRQADLVVVLAARVDHLTKDRQ